MNQRLLSAAILALGTLVGSQAEAASYAASVIGRNGDRHEIRNLTYQKQPEFEIYQGNRRQLLRFRQIERVTFGSDQGDGALPATILLRDGETLKAHMYAGGQGGVPHRAVVSGPPSGGGLLGQTDLGPFAIKLPDVRELRFHHTQRAEAQADLTGTVVDTDGRRFEVERLRFRGGTKFTYSQGRNRRSKQMSRIARIDFSTSAQSEDRGVNITFRSGKVTSGTVEASTVRVPGETDRLYEQRVFKAITGVVDGAPFSLGLHQIHLLRFESVAAQEADSSQTQPPPAAPAVP